MGSKLYEGIIALVDVETGEQVSVSVLISLDHEQIAYTLRPIGGAGRTTIIRSEAPEELPLVRRVLSAMHQLSLPA